LIVTGSMLKKMRLEAHIAKIEGGKVDPRLSTVNRILQILVSGKGKKCRDIMTKGVITAKPQDKVRDVSELMVRHAISQLPVVQDEKVIGMVTEEGIVRNLTPNVADEPVEKIMEPPLPSVPEDTDVAVIRPILEARSGVLVTRHGKLAS